MYGPTSCRTARGRENLEAAAGSLAIGWSEVRAGGRVGSGVNGATWSDRVWNPVRYDQRSAGLMSQPVCPVPRDLVSQPAASQRGRESRGLGGRYAGPRGLPPTQRQLAAENRGKLPPQPTESKMNIARKRPTKLRTTKLISSAHQLCQAFCRPNGESSAGTSRARRRVISGSKPKPRRPAQAGSSRLELIEAEIKKLTSQTAAAPDLELLEGRVKTLKKVRQEIKPREHYEGQLIFRDAMRSSRVLPVSQEGNNYREFDIGDSRILRIRVLHPDPPEHKIGADLIYENYDARDETVRLAFVQYKLWDRKLFYYDERLDKQIQKMFALTCEKGGLCAPPSQREMWVYRLPYCTAFFRPTDRLQSPNSTLHSTGLHMPICAMNFSWENTERSESPQEIQGYGQLGHAHNLRGTVPLLGVGIEKI